MAEHGMVHELSPQIIGNASPSHSIDTKGMTPTR
jgi:hypothetical protein